MAKIGGFGALVVVVIILAYANSQGLLGEAKNKDISNTRWQVAFKGVNDHVLQVGRISSSEVTVTKLWSGGSTAASGTYSGGKLIFTLSQGDLNATLTGIVAHDGKTMTGTILTTSPALNMQQEFTAVKL